MKGNRGEAERKERCRRTGMRGERGNCGQGIIYEREYANFKKE